MSGTSGCIGESAAYGLKEAEIHSCFATDPPRWGTEPEACPNFADICSYLPATEDCLSLAHLTLSKYWTFIRGHSPVEKLKEVYTTCETMDPH